MTSMQAIQLTRPDPSAPPSIHLTTLPIPTPPTPDHLIVQIKAAAIQPSDRFNARGGFNHTHFPIVPGRDFAGIVTAGPPARLGEPVFGTGGALLAFTSDGAHAQFCAVHRDLVACKPDGVSWVEAAAVGVPYTTALLMLKRARVGAGDRVLVVGSSGAVGSALVQIAKSLGCRTVLGAARRAEAEVNLLEDAALDGVKGLTGGKGVDVVLDTVGDLGLMTAAMKQLAKRGRYAWIAAPKGTPETSIQFDVFDAYRRELTLLGCNSASQDAQEVGEGIRELAKLLESGSIQPRKESTIKLTTLKDAVEAYKTGKVFEVIVMD